MAETKQYTEAGKAGQAVRSALSSAWRKTKSGLGAAYDYGNDLITEYVQEPFLNVYPQAVNLAAATTEFGAGVAGIPTSQGRYPYYNLKTRFDRQAPAAEQVEKQQAPIAEEPKAEEKQKSTIAEEPKAEEKQQSQIAEEPKPAIWRLMLKGGDPSQDKFYNTQKEANDALEKERARRKAERDYMVQTIGEKETNKRLGKEDKNIGAVVGLRFPAKTKAEEDDLRDKYMQNAAIGRVTAQPKSKEDVLRSKLQGLGATKEQQDRYFQNLNRLRSEREQREEESKARFKAFKSDIAAKDAAYDQLNQYERQLSTLKKAYRNAGANQDYSGQFKLGKLIDAYEAGVPKEMGARRKAAISGIISTRNQELEENFRREREARIERERLNRANPDYAQFQQYPEY